MGPTPLFVKRLARTEARLSGLLAITDDNTGLSDLRRGGIGLALQGILSPYAAVIGIEDAVSPVGGCAYLPRRFRPLLLVNGLRVALLPLLFFPASVRHPAHHPWEPPSVSGRQRKSLSPISRREQAVCVSQMKFDEMAQRVLNLSAHAATSNNSRLG